MAQQFLNRNSKIAVALLKILDPAHFIARELPHLTMSSEVSSFVEMEKYMDKHYFLIEKQNLYLPTKDEVIIVFIEKNNKFYRAKVECMLSSSRGAIFKIYLVDYGRSCQVNRECVFKIEKEYLTVPFQAVHFHLFGLEPLAYRAVPDDLQFAYRANEEWDPAARDYVDDICSAIGRADIEVVAVDKKQELHGRLSIQCNLGDICLNTVLIDKKFAFLKLETVADLCLPSLSKTDPVSSKPMQSLEAHAAECKELDKETELLQQLLKAKKYILEQGDALSPSAVSPRPSSPGCLEECQSDTESFASCTISLQSSFSPALPSHSKSNEFPFLSSNFGSSKTSNTSRKMSESSVGETISPTESQSIEEEYPNPPGHKGKADDQSEKKPAFKSDIFLKMYKTAFSKSAVSSSTISVSDMSECTSPDLLSPNSRQETKNEFNRDDSSLLGSQQQYNPRSPQSDDRIDKGGTSGSVTPRSLSMNENARGANKSSTECFLKFYKKNMLATGLPKVEPMQVAAIISQEQSKQALTSLPKECSKQVSASGLSTECPKHILSLLPQEPLKSVPSSHPLPTSGPKDVFMKFYRKQVLKADSNISQPSRCVSERHQIVSDQSNLAEIAASIPQEQSRQVLASLPKEHSSQVLASSLSTEHPEQISTLLPQESANLVSASPLKHPGPKDVFMKFYRKQVLKTNSSIPQSSVCADKQRNNLSEMQILHKSKNRSDSNSSSSRADKGCPSEPVEALSNNHDQLKVIVKSSCDSIRVNEPNVGIFRNVDKSKDVETDKNQTRRNENNVERKGGTRDHHFVPKPNIFLDFYKKAISKASSSNVESSVLAECPKNSVQLVETSSFEVLDDQGSPDSDCSIKPSLQYASNPLPEVRKLIPTTTVKIVDQTLLNHTEQKLQMRKCNYAFTDSSACSTSSCDDEKKLSLSIHVQCSTHSDVDSPAASPNKINHLASPSSNIQPQNLSDAFTDNADGYCNHSTDVYPTSLSSESHLSGNTCSSTVCDPERSDAKDPDESKNTVVEVSTNDVPSPSGETNAAKMDNASAVSDFSDVELSTLKMSDVMTILTSPTKEFESGCNSNAAIDHVDSEFESTSDCQDKSVDFSRRIKEAEKSKDFDKFVMDLSATNDYNSKGSDAYCDSYFMPDLDFSNLSSFDRQGVPALQLGQNTPPPMLHTEEANFEPLLQNNLKTMKFLGPSCIQSIGWPVVMNSRSFAAVAPPKSGKTVTYLLPLLSNLMSKTAYEEIPKSNGPIVVILCSSWKKMQSVNQQTQLFLGSSSRIRILTLCNSNPKSDVEKATSLLNGCDLLMATPACLLSFLGEDLTNFVRCCHFILDDGDDIIKYHTKYLTSLLARLLIDVKKRVTLKRPLQVALCVERWAKGVEKFVDKFLLDPILLFTSFLEAAIYAQVPTNLMMCQKSLKDSALLKLINSKKCAKTVVSTSCLDSAYAVYKLLSTSTFQCLLAHEAIPHFELDAVKRRWSRHQKTDSPIVLVITDAVLGSVCISDAYRLVHYDLPEVSRLQFSYRFASIADSFNGTSEEAVKSECNIFVMMDDCQTQAVALRKILQRLHSDVPKELRIKACEQKNLVNADNQLCHYMKTLGVCPIKKCAKRHFIDRDLDAPAVLPKEGDVKAVIRHVINATHFVAKILSYIEPTSGKVYSRTAEYAKISINIQDFYAQPENQTPLPEVKVDDVCCVKESDTHFYRAKIVQTSEEFNGKQKVKLLYLDEGWIKTFTSDKLLVLHDDFKSRPYIAAEIFLCNVKPTDSCPEWNPQANRFVHGVIEKQTVEGKIALCLGNTLFLHPMVIREHNLTFIHDCLNMMQVAKELKEKNFAVENKEHLELLYKNCEGKIDLPKKTCSKTTTVATKPSVMINYAFLNIQDFEEVYVSAVENPDKFFVQLNKFADKLDEMHDDIALKIATGNIRHCLKVEKRMFCLAPIPEDGRYYRGEILDLVKDKDETMAHVFFVDFGDNDVVKESELFALPQELMLLPFQAIQCQLSAVSAPVGGWTEEATDVFVDITRNDQNLMKLLTLMAWKKCGQNSGRNCYVVDVYDSETIVSDFLISKGLALSAEPPWSMFEKIIPNVGCHSDLESQSEGENSLLPDEKDNEALMCSILAQYLISGEKHSQPDVKEKGTVMKMAGPTASTCTTNITSVLNKPRETLPSSNCGLGEPQNEDLTKATAPLTWWNTDSEVTVTIEVLGIDELKYDLTFFDDGFGFSCIQNSKKICLEETLYGEVDQNKTQVKNLGHSLKLVFEKNVSVKWPRLIKCPKKRHYIVYDFNHLDLGSDTEADALECPNEQGMPSMAIEENEPHFSESDAEDSDDNEGEGQAKSWSKMGEPNGPSDLFDMLEFNE